MLLLFFTLSITPRLYLHDIFASHQDMITKSSSHEAELKKDGYSCNLNELVATSPFTESATAVTIETPLYFPELHVRYTSQVASATPQFFALRGPPLLA